MFNFNIKQALEGKEINNTADLAEAIKESYHFFTFVDSHQEAESIIAERLEEGETVRHPDQQRVVIDIEDSRYEVYISGYAAYSAAPHEDYVYLISIV